ncbi:MAG: hypothetical protein P4L85_22805 [Paludisphaera borealis]|uniref:hypothetical protein n=1 Tax=Paludisphaera borealis TaxID=1387353 RepID=UPI00284635F8|nr:hypothetical protein [Paludisphaera borealis]MDR3622198.1 hypothetical protein [Paludisphaera borealis]
MKAAFRLTLALIATFGASGCRTAGLSPSARPTPTVVPEPKVAFHLDEFVDEHNRNAERVESLRAKATITASMDTPGSADPTKGVVSGRLSLLRPKNFQLDLSHYQNSVADIGSNEERFWFWVQSKGEENKHVYYCDYADLPTANLAGTYQPDWIVDALGLKTITPDEAATIRVAPGAKPETTMLTFPATAERSSYERVMIVSDKSRRLVEYRVLDRAGKKLIGRATVKQYSDVTLKNNDDDAPAAPRACHIASGIALEWMDEKLSLDILLKDLVVNEPFSDKMKANFVEPKPRGYTPLDLAQATRNHPRARGEETAVRETLPAPEPRGRGRLGPSVEIHGAEPDSGARTIATPARAKPPARRPAPKPAAVIEPTLLPINDDVVGAVTPRPPGSPYQSAAAGDLSSGLALER